MAKPKLSIKDKGFIENNYDRITPTKIAGHLGKEESDVRDYIINIMNSRPLEELDEDLFENSDEPEWDLIREQFTARELKYFEKRFKELSDQFKNDVRATEKSQVFQAIELEIFMHQNKRNRKRSVEETNRLEHEIQREKEKDEFEFDQQRLDMMQQQLTAYTASHTSTSKEYNELSKKHGDIMESLKGTRDQRIKQETDSKYNLLAIIKELEDEDKRRGEMILMELHRAARNKEQNRLENLHTYKDDKPDIPFMTAESILKIKDENAIQNISGYERTDALEVPEE